MQDQLQKFTSNKQSLMEEPQGIKPMEVQSMTQMGKTPEEVLPYLIAGEPDD